jgi:hypothetical protein
LKLFIEWSLNMVFLLAIDFSMYLLVPIDRRCLVTAVFLC